ncbi:flagellar biosynthetic protein FliO [Marinobacter adhaerens]|jgi:flagellar protein FliO/FliZ|uniref:Flagellar protein n=3 Tax=Marinobacter TaxID=2742 RepID=A0A3D8H837_9GAMM|nr:MULTISPECIES: flagellar biosynthetic protein FliO [Marinobacter]MTI76151.1 flagellar biosynthetic protein FliO [Marinobacter sp.]ADP98077.1 flagellar biosynthesis protein, FliO [Marinobacter adhaerens HP15]MBW3225934.1 flagellar biosynthetic protein FliO [Marinobacter adhaerens]MBW4977402.1 flagellar biosynthetic protein FliO [Marinobacter adhaerens]PHS47743.1 MAG: flagellar biosynthetic protein FliO [Marinobacter sp.]|tara:strand:+ start:45 stop:494 length:450 start_codon:yes stop_codon:yes gene_type:complete
MWSKSIAVLALLLINPAFAQETAKTVAPDSPVRAPDTVGTIVSLGLGLVAVIAVIYGCAWIIRRMNGMTGMNNNAIKVVSVMAIGARERIALIEVGGQQILLGITPSAIRTLHVFDEPVVEAGSAGSSDFARRLQGMIGKSWTSPTRND